MQLDESKDFVAMENNGDGTTTLTLNLLNQTFAPNPIIMVIACDLSEMVHTLMPTVDTDDETFKKFCDKSTLIPHGVEE